MEALPSAFLHHFHGHLWQWSHCEQNYSHTQLRDFQQTFPKFQELTNERKTENAVFKILYLQGKLVISPNIFFSRKTCTSNRILPKELTDKTENPSAALLSAGEKDSSRLLLTTDLHSQGDPGGSSVDHHQHQTWRWPSCYCVSPVDTPPCCLQRLKPGHKYFTSLRVSHCLLFAKEIGNISMSSHKIYEKMV